MEGTPKNSVEVGPEVELQNLEKEIDAKGGVEEIKKVATSKYGYEWARLSEEITATKEKLKDDKKNLKLIAVLVDLYKIVIKKNRQFDIEEYDKKMRPGKPGYGQYTDGNPKDF